MVHTVNSLVNCKADLGVATAVEQHKRSMGLESGPCSVLAC